MAELRFQEGFKGESVEVRLEGSLVSSFAARTRTQIGVAHVVNLDARPGQRVTIALPATGATSAFQLRPDTAFVRVDLEGGDLKVTQRDEPEGFA